MTLIGLAFVYAPSIVLAQEDTVYSVECRVTKTCAPNGDCRDDASNVVFQLETRSDAHADEGPYEIAYDRISANLESHPMSGTLFWSEGQDDIQFLQWIGTGSEDEELGYAIWTGVFPTFAGTVRFLTCRSTTP